MKAGPAVRIARNDPALAHAMAAHELERLDKRSHKVFSSLRDWMTVEQISRLLRNHFGGLVLRDNVIRAHGSRAQAYWLLLDTVDARDSEFVNDLTVLRVGKWKGRIVIGRIPVQVSSHVVARFFQRTLGHSDLQGIALLARHIERGIHLTSDNVVSVGDGVITATPEGALMWRAIPRHVTEGVRLRATTWIAAETAVDPELLKAMQRSDASTISVALVPAERA